VVVAAHTINARGIIPAPGFIDPHPHIEAQLTDSLAQAQLVPDCLCRV